ncbi:MAG: OmpA family protein [Ghiorsea sp.]|nr:OmpA family protein [Ghiorsea sp.]
MRNISAAVLMLSTISLAPQAIQAASYNDTGWRVGVGGGFFQMDASYPNNTDTFSQNIPAYLASIGYMTTDWLEMGLMITGGGKSTDTQNGKSIELSLPALPQFYMKLHQDVGMDWGIYEVISVGWMQQEALINTGNAVYTETVTVAGLGVGISWHLSSDLTIDVGLFSPTYYQEAGASSLETSQLGALVSLNYAFGTTDPVRVYKPIPVAPKPIPKPAPKPVPVVAPVVVIPVPVVVVPEIKPLIEIAEEGEVIVLEGVLFTVGGSSLDASSTGMLNKVVATLKKMPLMRVEIAAHSDSVGLASYNLILSQKRAASVRNYLIMQGVTGDRIEATGYGASKPVADNATRAGRAKNRRVEMRVL